MARRGWLARSLPVRKLDDEGRAAVGARLAAEPTLMLLDDAVGHPEAEPGALAGWFGREERVEDPGEQLRRNAGPGVDRKSTRLNSSHGYISYAVFCLKKKKKNE